jgi:hypothetical protein
MLKLIGAPDRTIVGMIVQQALAPQAVAVTDTRMPNRPPAH